MATTARPYPCFNGPVMICSIFWDSNEQIAFAQFLFNLSMISFSSATICFAVPQREHSPAMLCALGRIQYDGNRYHFLPEYSQLLPEHRIFLSCPSPPITLNSCLVVD